MALSARGARAVQPALPYWARFAEGVADLYDEASNPAGYILMAVAEARGSFERMIPRLTAARAAAIVPDTGAYANMLGRAALRGAFAATMSRTALRGRVAVDPEQLCVSAGCGSVLLQLAMLLLDPGDGVLLPTPTYAALYNDIGTLAHGVVVDVPTEAAGYRLTRRALDDARTRAAAAGVPLRMLLLLNPENPTGVIHSAAELRLARGFCAEHGLHLVVDEVYANSVHDPAPEDAAGGGGGGGHDAEDGQGGDDAGAAAAGDAGDRGTGAGCRRRVRFHSIVELCAEDAGVAAQPPAPPALAAAGAPPAARASFLGDSIHVLWGFSKDWAMSGYRVGVLYTHNAALLTALSNVNYFTACSNDTQDMLAGVLADATWCDDYLAHCRGQLRAAFTGLRDVLVGAGIPFVHPQGGMFVWLDLRALLPPPAAGDDAAGFARERRLTDELFREARVLMTPGEACHAAAPGWYRCCFAWMPPRAVRVGFERLAAYAAGRRAACQ